MNALSNELSNIGLNIQVCIPCYKLKEFPLVPKTGSLIVFGNGGSEFWKHTALPMDDFSKDQITQWGNDFLNEDLSNNFLYPSNSPARFFLGDCAIPLQQLGRKINLCAQSPIGIDINPTYGLWFAFRAVVFTKQDLPAIELNPFQSPCETCTTKDCLSGETFRNKRLACPVGAHHRYSDEQIKYHESISSQLRF